MSLNTEHRKSFLTYRRAGCACGVVIEAVSRKDAAQRLAVHMAHPSAAQKIAGAPKEHQDCKIERWSDRWGVCQDHLVYIDMEIPAEGEQLEMSFT